MARDANATLRGPDWPTWTHAAAILASVALNALFAWALLEVSRVDQPPPQEQRTDIVFIRRAAPPRVQEPPRSQLKVLPNSQWRHRQRTPPAAPVQAMKSNGTNEVTTPALDLSLPPASRPSDARFGERVVEQFGADDMQSRPRLNVRFQDSSIGGRLQRMVRGAECADLKRALARARNGGDGSTTKLVMEALSELGCM
jgi:hypothetical protein